MKEDKLKELRELEEELFAPYVSGLRRSVLHARIRDLRYELGMPTKNIKDLVHFRAKRGAV